MSTSQATASPGQPRRTAADGLRLAFAQLTHPAAAWSAMDGRGRLWAALSVQVLIYLCGGLVSTTPLSDLLELAGYTPHRMLASQLLIVVLRIAVVVILANFGWAAVVKGSLLLANIRIDFRRAATWIAYGSIPFALGYFFGAVQFWFFQPLTDNQFAILAWIIRPFSFGLATVLPHSFPPLSLPWFYASFLDAFGVWSGWLLITGARKYLGLSRVSTLWCACILLLLFIVAIALIWQFIQMMAIGGR